MVGGTGLYLKAGLYDYDFKVESESNTYENLSNEELYHLALQKDKSCSIHPNNRKRLVRFLNKDGKEEKASPKPLYEATYIGLTTDRENLYNIINKRVEIMFQNGLLEEAKTLFSKYPNSTILNSAIGYKELKQYFSNEISLEEAKELIKKNSRHYAKRQYTWFNNQMEIKWFDVDFNDFSKTSKEIVEYIENQKK